MADPRNPGLLSVGIVGAGVITTNLHLPVLANIADVRVEWIADTDENRAAVLSRAVGASPYRPGAMADTHVVCIAIPVPGREAWLAEVAAASAAALVEKPFANNAAAHRAALTGFHEWGLAAGYQRRFYETTRFIKRAVDGRWFGVLRRIVHREGGRVFSGGPTGYADAPVDQGGGLLKNLGCHGVDLALYVTTADRATVGSVELEMDAGVDRRAHILAELIGPHGRCDLDLLVSSVDSQPNVTRYEFDTATLTASVAPNASIALAAVDGGSATTIGLGDAKGATTSAQACHLMWRDFLACTRAGLPATNSAESALLGAELIDVVFANRGIVS